MHNKFKLNDVVYVDYEKLQNSEIGRRIKHDENSVRCNPGHVRGICGRFALLEFGGNILKDDENTRKASKYLLETYFQDESASILRSSRYSEKMLRRGLIVAEIDSLVAQVNYDQPGQRRIMQSIGRTKRNETDRLRKIEIIDFASKKVDDIINEVFNDDKDRPTPYIGSFNDEAELLATSGVGRGSIAFVPNENNVKIPWIYDGLRWEKLQPVEEHLYNGKKPYKKELVWTDDSEYNELIICDGSWL